MGPGRRRSEEHLLGEAILGRLGYGSHPMMVHRYHSREGLWTLSRKPEVAGNAVARRVFCKPCNEG